MTGVLPFDPLAAGSPETLVLFSARGGGLVLLAPVLSVVSVAVGCAESDTDHAAYWPNPESRAN